MTDHPHHDQYTIGHHLYRIRLYLFTMLFPRHDRSSAASLINDFIIVMIVLSSFAIILESIEFIETNFATEMKWFDQFSLIVFTIEYIARLLCGGLKSQFIGKRFSTLRYALTPMALLDLIVILPFFLPIHGMVDLRFLRLIRLIRLVKLARFIVPIWTDFLHINKGRTLRQKIYSALNRDVYSGDMHALVDITLGLIIFLSVIAVMLESVAGVHEFMAAEFILFDTFSVAVFSLEYILRLYCCVENPDTEDSFVGRLKYMLTPTAIIDLLAILPFYLVYFVQIDLRFLRVIRLMRLLKFTRYNKAMNMLTEVVMEQLPALSTTLFILMIMIVFAASIVFLFEHEAQPDKFTSIPEATYWAVITLLSVGYGDIYPVTPVGQFLTMLITIIGLGLVALPTGILASGFTEKMRQQTEEYKQLLEEKVSDGTLTQKEKIELSIEASSLGLSKIRQRELQAEELSAIEREQKEDAFLVASGSTLPLRPINTELSDDRSMPVSDFETLMTHVSRLSLQEKSRLMARLAEEMARRIDVASDKKDQ
jgi:voltage-gated potassium channel